MFKKDKKLKIGPWSDEPNEIKFKIDDLYCVILRHNKYGHLCGYVGVKQNHFLYGVNYHNVEKTIDVHGGLTFSGKMYDEFDVWFFGFDCAHVDDLIPISIYFEPPDKNKVYRNVSYVKSEIIKLAKQLKEYNHV